MIKLYPSSPSGVVEYWETWEDRRGTAVVHVGPLGEPGSTAEVDCGGNFEAWATSAQIVNEALGWTRLGHCTGVDFSGEMTVIAEGRCILDPARALRGRAWLCVVDQAEVGRVRNGSGDDRGPRRARHEVSRSGARPDRVVRPAPRWRDPPPRPGRRPRADGTPG